MTRERLRDEGTTDCKMEQTNWRLRPSGGPGPPSSGLARPSVPSQPQAGGSWAVGVWEQGLFLFCLLRTLADVINSCAPHCPTPQWGCTHKGEMRLGQSTNGAGSQQSTRPTVRNQGDGGDEDTTSPREGDRGAPLTKAQDDQGLLTLRPPPGQGPEQRDIGPWGLSWLCHLRHTWLQTGPHLSADPTALFPCGSSLRGQPTWSGALNTRENGDLGTCT